MATASSLRLGKHLKELRIHLCQKSPQSQGVRDFIENHYVTLKKNNPTFPILIRECKGVKPKIYARYGYGHETSVGLSDKNSNDVLATVESLARDMDV